jgi:hypothetical protein
MNIAALGILAGAGIVSVALVMVLFSGVVLLHILWGWFVVPLGVPQIGIAWAVGLMAVAALFVPVPPPAPEGKSVESLASIIAKPILALAFGWLAKQFM